MGFSIIIFPLTILDFNTLIIRERYLGGQGHEIAIGLWDTTTDTYEESYTTIVTYDGSLQKTVKTTNYKSVTNNQKSMIVIGKCCRQLINSTF